MHYYSSIFSAFLVAVCLSSCSSYEESFSTEPGVGSGWKSMSDTYVLENNKNADREQKHQKETTLLDPLYKQEVNDAQQDKLYCSGKSESIERRPEEYLRVWTLPHQDNQGNMVEGYYVRSLMKPGQWVIASSGRSSDSSSNSCGEPS